MNKIDKLVEEMCPDGIDFVRLEQVCSKVPGIRWQAVADQHFEYIDLTSVDRTTKSIIETSTIDGETAPSRAKQLVKDGDVIFGTTRPTLNRFCLINRRHDGQVCSTGFCVLRPDQAQVIPNFLFHIIGSQKFQRHVRSNEKGASYPSISDAEVKKFQIPLPPLEVQEEIVRILADVPDLRPGRRALRQRAVG